VVEQDGGSGRRRAEDLVIEARGRIQILERRRARKLNLRLGNREWVRRDQGHNCLDPQLYHASYARS